MSVQPETNNYEAGIYQLQTTDPVQGGLGGVSNLPLLQLANRTTWLKSRVDDILSGSITLPGYALLNNPVFTGDPRAPTAAAGDNDTSLATTAFVQNRVGGVLSLSIAGTGNITLTAEQAGVGIIIFTGALTGARTVIVPTAPTARWIVRNNATGSFSVTVRTSAGTGPVVPAGSSVWLYCDGTNVVEVAATDISGNAATATTLQTARTINGTSFNGSANITTANWGTARTLTIGNTGKSVNGSANVSWSLAEIGAIGPDSPAFTGNPTAPTQPHFDADTSIATTEFVQRALGSFQGLRSITTTTTLTEADVGRYINASSTSNFTITLPLASAAPAGSTITIHSLGNGLVTVQRQSTNIISANGQQLTSHVIRFGESVTFVSNGSSQWTFFGTGSLSETGAFSRDFSANGWQRLPSGLIIQWGIINNIAHTALFSPVFPISFQSTCLHASYVATLANSVGQMNPVVSATSATSFTGTNSTGITNNFIWFALGV